MVRPWRLRARRARSRPQKRWRAAGASTKSASSAGRDALIALGLALLGAAAAQAPQIGGKPLMGYASALLFVGRQQW